MKTFLSLIFILLSVIAFTQSFNETIITGNFPDPYTEKVADMDGNTYEDIVACGVGGVTWFKNLDGTNFETINIFDTAWVRDIDLIDFDGDTDWDIVGFNSTSGALFWLNNDGSENFTYTQITDTIPDIKYITVVDVDNDGDIDIFYNIYNGGYYDIYLYENNAGAFTATKVDRVSFSKDIYTFDYQNDGDIDFLTKVNYFPFDTEEIGIMINDGANTFTELVIYESTGDVDINDAQFVDIDNSGTGDLVIADNVQNELFWLQDAGWTRHNIRTSVDVSSVLVQDYNNDGIKDVSFKDENTSNYSFYVLQGANPGPSMSFTDRYSFELEVSSNDLEAFDANNDSYPEWAYSTAYKDEVGYFHNNSNFSFTNNKLSSYIPLPDCLRRVDLDLDGDMDIITFASEESLSWYEAQSDGTYIEHIIITTLDDPYQLEVEDMNGDGYPDIITASVGDDDFSIWYNDGSQVFTEQLITWSNTQLDNPSFFSIADLDNDGDKDFVVIASAASTRPKGIFWIRNDGGGSYSSPIAIQSGLNYMGEVVTYDFDNDGNIDIVVADHSWGTAGLRLIKNNGGGSFTVTTPVSFKAEAIRLGDIDSDGLMDFLVRNDATNDIVWYKNNGNFTFTGDTIVMSESYEVEFEVCDAGNDGITDILFYTDYFGFSSTSFFTAGILINDGSENFSLTYYLQNQTSINSGIAVDLEMDGDMDFILAYDYADKISIFENLATDLADPTIITWPIASDINSGESLASSVLSGGVASVPGSFDFLYPATTPPVGYNNEEVKFTPTDQVTYNSVIGSAQVLVIDTTPPTVVCQNITVYLDGAGNASITAADIDGGSTDDGGISSLVASRTTFNCADIGSQNVTLTVTDNFSNVDSCVATVTVADTTSPIAVCQNFTAYLDGSGSATVYATDLDGGTNDNCAVDTIFMIDGGMPVDQKIFSCSDIGPNLIQFVALDVSMNFSTCVATVTILDTVSPTAVCSNPTVYLDDTGNASISGADIDGGSTDNCGIDTQIISQNTFSCTDATAGVVPANDLVISGVYDGPLLGGTPKGVELYAIHDIADLSVYGIGSANNGGGTDGEEFTFPAVSLSAGNYIYVASEATEFANFFGFAPDYTSGALAINGDDAIELFYMGSVIDVFGDINVDGSGQAWDYMDGWAYRNDDTGPDGSTFMVSDWTYSGINVFDPDTLNSTSVTPFPIGTYSITLATPTPVTLTVQDASGNSDYCTANITVLDTIAPIAVCQNNTFFLNGAGVINISAAIIDGGSTDNCGIASVNASQTSFTCSNLGANTVTLTVTDNSGNVSTCDATITILDSIKPTAVCQNITVYLDGTGSATITATDIDGGSTDNCSSVSLSASQTVFTCADIGANSVILTVTDGSGNTSTCTSTVTVADTISPTASCQNITVYLDGTGSGTITAADIDGGSTDNCSSVSLSASQTVFTCADIGANSVTLTVTDGSGNTSACTSTVTVADTISPTASCQNITVYLDGTGSATITAADIDGGSTDNCSSVSLSASQTVFTCADIGANSVTLTVTDGSGNSSNCTATVTISDTITPTISCIGDTVICDSILPDYTSLASTSDNCGIMSVVQSPVAGTAISSLTAITLTVTDSNMNSDFCTFNVTPNTANTATDSITACFTYTWIDGITYTASTDTAMWTIPNAMGCDSVITLNLTINTVDTSLTVADPMITANATGALYQWLDCNNSFAIISGETAQSFTAGTNGSFAVEIIENGCTDTSACVAIISTGIDNTIFEGVQIFPNPNSGQFSIDFGGLNNPMLRIYTVEGKLIMEKRNITDALITIEFDEAAGIYVLEIISDGFTRQYKLIKE